MTAPQHLDPDHAGVRVMTEDEFCARDRMPPVISFAEQLKVLYLIRRIRELRNQLEHIAKPAPVARVTRITVHEQVALFDLFHAIDDLFPGGVTLWPSDSTDAVAEAAE
jgi:hypothetical protein